MTDGTGGLLHTPFIRTDWHRAYAGLQLFRGRSLRTWRDLDRLVAWLRADLGYQGVITLEEAGSPALARRSAAIRATLLAEEAIGARAPASGGPSRPADDADGKGDP